MNLYLLVFIKRSKVNAEKKSPLFLRITLNNARVEISLNRFVSDKDWDNKAQKVKGKSNEAFSINEQIRVFKTKLYDHYSKLIEKGEQISAKKLKEVFLGVDKNKKTLIEIFQFHNKQMENQIGKDFAKGTFKRYETCLKLVKQYLNEELKLSDILLENLKLDFITGFDYFLRTKRNCNNNTTVKYLKNLKKIINLARAYEWINHDPFINYKSKLERVDREILTQNEIDLIYKKEISIKRLEYVRDVFIFCCYTGLAFSDVKKLSKGNIVIGIDGNYWIHVNRTKTKVISKIPILPIAQEILSKYTNNPECHSQDVVLPVPSNQKYNAYLKEIADICGITKNLTTHLGRHAFSTTITLNNDIPIETVSKMLGHRSVKTTEIYAKVLEGKISHDMSKLMRKRDTISDLKIINQ